MTTVSLCMIVKNEEKRIQKCLDDLANKQASPCEKAKPGENVEPWLNYHLAAEYLRLRDYDKAFDAINASILEFLAKNVMPPAEAYQLKYQLLITAKNFDVAHQSIGKAILLYPDYVELHYDLGLILFHKGEYDRAIKAFLYCLVLGEGTTDYLIKTGVGSFRSLYYLGLCYEKLGKNEEALAAYRQVMAYYPGFKDTQAKISCLNNNFLGGY